MPGGEKRGEEGIRQGPDTVPLTRLYDPSTRSLEWEEGFEIFEGVGGLVVVQDGGGGGGYEPSMHLTERP